MEAKVNQAVNTITLGKDRGEHWLYFDRKIAMFEKFDGFEKNGGQSEPSREHYHT